MIYQAIQWVGNTWFVEVCTKSQVNPTGLPFMIPAFEYRRIRQHVGYYRHN